MKKNNKLWKSILSRFKHGPIKLSFRKLGSNWKKIVVEAITMHILGYENDRIRTIYQNMYHIRILSYSLEFADVHRTEYNRICSK